MANTSYAQGHVTLKLTNQNDLLYFAKILATTNQGLYFNLTITFYPTTIDELDLYNYRTSDKWHMIDLKWIGTGRWTIESVLSTTLEDALFSNTHDEKLQQLQQKPIELIYEYCDEDTSMGMLYSGVYESAWSPDDQVLTNEQLSITEYECTASNLIKLGLYDEESLFTKEHVLKNWDDMQKYATSESAIAFFSQPKTQQIEKMITKFYDEYDVCDIYWDVDTLYEEIQEVYDKLLE